MGSEVISMAILRSDGLIVDAVLSHPLLITSKGSVVYDLWVWDNKRIREKRFFAKGAEGFTECRWQWYSKRGKAGKEAMSIYTCHSDNKGQAPRKSSYMAQDGHERISTGRVEQRRIMVIKTDWEADIGGKNCGHIRSLEDRKCDGCGEQR
jgi:hypothetical protein